jgi:hypothetical protein
LKVLAIWGLPFETSAFNSLFYGRFILNQDSPHQPAASARSSQSGVLGSGEKQSPAKGCLTSVE